MNHFLEVHVLKAFENSLPNHRALTYVEFFGFAPMISRIIGFFRMIIVQNSPLIFILNADDREIETG